MLFKGKNLDKKVILKSMKGLFNNIFGSMLENAFGRPRKYAGMWEDLGKNSQAVVKFTRQFSLKFHAFFNFVN